MRRTPLLQPVLIACLLAASAAWAADAGTVPVKNPGSTDPARQTVDPYANLPPGEPGKDYTPVVTPGGSTLPYTVVDGVKVYHLIIEAARHEFAPGLVADIWGYNGQTPGPTIEAVEGDKVRIFATNHLPEKTTVHWHGILLPNAQDGVAGLNQEGIKPGETLIYEFQLRQHGTFMYHSHFDEMTQMGMGTEGNFIIHPRHPTGRRPDRDFSIHLSEWDIPAGAAKPNPNEMSEFNILTMNGKAYPGTVPLVVKQGDLVRVRFGNLSAMDHHPIHLHGYNFKITETDGGEIPAAAQWPETTVLVSVGTTRTIEFIADNPGDWAFHCHMTHHVMNQMGHGLPNMLGVDASGLDEKIRDIIPEYMTMGSEGMGEMGEMGMRVPPNSIPMVGGAGPHGYIDMGGMFTILKVRANLKDYSDPGWYEQPPETLTHLATEADLKHNGITVTPLPSPLSPPHPELMGHAMTNGDEKQPGTTGDGGHSMKDMKDMKPEAAGKPKDAQDGSKSKDQSASPAAPAEHHH